MAAARRTRAVAMTPGTAAAAGTPPAAMATVAAVATDRSSAPREMFDATCSNCGKDAKVPFRPTNGKPVYCSDCFRSMKGN